MNSPVRNADSPSVTDTTPISDIISNEKPVKPPLVRRFSRRMSFRDIQIREDDCRNVVQAIYDEPGIRDAIQALTTRLRMLALMFDDCREHIKAKRQRDKIIAKKRLLYRSIAIFIWIVVGVACLSLSILIAEWLCRPAKIPAIHSGPKTTAVSKSTRTTIVVKPRHHNH